MGRTLIYALWRSGSAAFEKVETILHDDSCQQHLMKSSIMRRLNLVLFTGKKAMRNAALSDAAMKPKMFSAGPG